jgi:hypothetical protein
VEWRRQFVALPDDPDDRLRCYRNALRNWKYDGYVEFKPRARDGLKEWVPSRALREIKRLLFEFVDSGGKIDEQVETRLEYVGDEFHYDLRVKIDDRLIYFETILRTQKPDDPDDPRIEVVNVHDV